jgi:lipoprotein signal peptidase
MAIDQPTETTPMGIREKTKWAFVKKSSRIIALSLGVLAVDQLIKTLSSWFTAPNRSFEVVGSYFHVTRAANAGALFSWLPAEQNWVIRHVPSLFFGLFVIVFLFFRAGRATKLEKAGAILLMGGGTSNLLDYWKGLWVFDTFRVCTPTTSCLIFNTADIAIQAGVLLIILSALIQLTGSQTGLKVATEK